MAHVSDLIATDIEQYLRAHENKSLLRFITCGSVDDGKSTLIGRLLYESKMLFEDQLAAVEADSKKYGTQGEAIDFALLVDGLAAEREQGITIDVAYRFFSTDKRKFIVADTPGHEQYTRNMVTGASTADAAILMVDARKGILTQTRRHSYLVNLIGIRHIVVAINKMDLVDYAEGVFRRIAEDYTAFSRQLGIEQVTFIPMSAFRGDNITSPSAAMPWYHGTTLMGYLETVEVDDGLMQRAPFRLPVQWVNRPNLDFRGFAGSIAGGVVRPGDRIRVQPSGRESTVARIVTRDGDLDRAVAGQSVTLTLADEIDISRGDVISTVEAPAEVADQFECTVVWMHDEPMLAGRPYLLKIGARTVDLIVTDLNMPNLDGIGFVKGLDHFGIPVEGRRVLVVGAGGGGHAVAAAIALRQPAHLAIYNRTPERAHSLAQRLQPLIGARAAAVATNDPAGFDLIVNCTSQGLKPGDEMPFDPARVNAGAAVVDIIMKREPTPVLAACRARGIRAEAGYEMLVQQVPEYLRFMGFDTLAETMQQDLSPVRALLYPK